MANGKANINRSASQRYDGLPARVALKADSPYFLVTQVRGVAGLTPKHRSTLESLGLGRVGKSALVPAQRPLISAIDKVAPYVIARPIEDPEELPEVRVLGAHSRQLRAERQQRRKQRLRVETPGAEEAPPSPELVEAMGDILRDVQSTLDEAAIETAAQPTLDESQIEAAAEVLASEPHLDAVELPQEELARVTAAVEQAIADAGDDASSDRPSRRDF